MISVHFQGKPFNITVTQVYAPTSNAEEAEVECFYEDLQDLLELTPQKRCPFYYRGLECKSRKSRNTWSNRQIWPWNTEWSRVKTNTVLPRKCTGHSKHPLPTTQEKYSLSISNFLEEISSLPILLFSSISLHWSLKKAFLSLLAIFWNSAFK